MFGLNKKLKQNTTSSTSKVEKKSEEKKLPSNANSTQLSKKAIPDLICKVSLSYYFIPRIYLNS